MTAKFLLTDHLLPETKKYTLLYLALKGTEHTWTIFHHVLQDLATYCLLPADQVPSQRGLLGGKNKVIILIVLGT